MSSQEARASADLGRTPFDWIAPRALPRAWWAVTIVVALLSLWLGVLGRALETAVAPQGIVSFELAGGAAAARAILESWPAAAREAAMLVQGVDFLYLVAYPAWFSLAAALLARRLGGGWARGGLWVAWAVLLAAPLDAAENLALIRQLEFGASETAARVAWACAVPKFALVALAAGWVAVGAAVAGLRHLCLHSGSDDGL